MANGLQLTEPCRYAFACLNALLLRELYPEDDEKDFRQNFIDDLLEYLCLQRAKEVVNLLLREGGHDVQSYVDFLLSEPLFQRDGSLILYNALHFAVHKGTYDSRTRSLLQHMAFLLRLKPEQFDMLEDNIVNAIDHSSQNGGQPSTEGEKQKERQRRIKRIALVGAASVGGGVLIGLTGGLAAPLVGLGIGAVVGSSAVAAAFSTVAGIALVGSLFGAAGAGLAGYKMKKRLGDLDEFHFKELPEGEGSSLHVTMAVSSWLLPLPEGNCCNHSFSPYLEAEKLVERLVEHWEALAHSRDQYLLIYEPSLLLELGHVLDIALPKITKAVMMKMGDVIFSRLLLQTLSIPRSMMKLTSVIDNPWGTCNRRCVQVGEQLADVLLKRIHGNRPVTLIGYNLGGRVIFYCLREMHRRGNYKGVVQDAIIIGAPVTGKRRDWIPLVQVVGGRLVNGFSSGDWLLKLLYRASSASVAIAGLQPIDIQHRRLHNLDLSAVVDGHLDYQNKINEIVRAALLTSAASMPAGPMTDSCQSSALVEETEADPQSETIKPDLGSPAFDHYEQIEEDSETTQF